MVEKASIVEHAAAEPLRPMPAVPYPATITEQRRVSAQALVARAATATP